MKKVNEEQQKYQKKKNILIILSLVLVLVLVCIICLCFIYVKQHPKEKFLSPEEIEIKTMLVNDYIRTEEQINYTSLTQQNEIALSEDKTITLNEGKITIDETVIRILNNEIDINNNIQSMYKNFNKLYIIQEEKLYIIVTETLEQGTSDAEQLLNTYQIKDLVTLNDGNIYALTNTNQIINIETEKEYNQIIKELPTPNGILYVYKDYSFALEEGKRYTDEAGNPIKFNIRFSNYIIDDNNIIYEIDYQAKTLKTSNLGSLRTLGYAKNVETNKYEVNVKSSTGFNIITSDYYDTK